MKKFLLIILIMMSAPAFADSVMFEKPLELDGYRLQPCRYWHRDSGSRAYVCDYLDSFVYVTTVDEVQNVVDELISKINELEKRIKALEDAP